MDKVNQRIVCAAIRNQNGTIICGPRHFDMVMIGQIRTSTENWDKPDQGFVDQFGKYLSREEAYEIAIQENQVLRRCGGDAGRLFSENLY